jgi:hypothetical protein
MLPLCPFEQLRQDDVRNQARDVAAELTTSFTSRELV